MNRYPIVYPNGYRSSYRRNYSRNGGLKNLGASHTDLPRMIVTEGRKKGKTGTLDGFTTTVITLKLDDGSSASVHYAKVEFLASDGTPNIAPVSDMTGREIVVGSWLTYSQNSGSRGSSHALGLGQVTKVTPSGGLVVNAYLQDGERQSAAYTVNIRDPDRSLLLPCEPTTMTIWLMKDFQDLDTTGFDPNA